MRNDVSGKYRYQPRFSDKSCDCPNEETFSYDAQKPSDTGLFLHEIPPRIHPAAKTDPPLHEGKSG
jgi:hypothetical protein